GILVQPPVILTPLGLLVFLVDDADSPRVGSDETLLLLLDVCFDGANRPTRLLELPH
ncbi:MAG: hypothetical protein GWN83_15115, partial [Gemmatimonadetes bacterium]|nr:hypothetical protein [Gemmatimonadota bacterium]